MMRLHLLTCLLVALHSFSFAAINPSTAPAHSSTAINLSIDSIHQINCSRATGYLSVVANGGVQPYTYNWSNGNTGPVATSLTVGTYTITVTDATNATDILSVEITEDFSLPTADAGEDFTVTCDNSVFFITGSGSTGPEFLYHWTASDGGIIKADTNTLRPTLSHIGTFTLTVTNSTNGCTASDLVTVTALHEPPTVTATGGVFNCSYPVTLTSTFPSTNTIFVWNGPGGYVSNQLNPQVSIVGTFKIKVTDTITTCINTANAIVTADTAKPTVLPIGGTLNCMQSSVTLSGTYGPSGVTFAWSGPGGFTSTLQNPVVSVPGNYVVIVTNPANGCSKVGFALVGSNFVPPTANATVSGMITCTAIAVQLNGSGSPAGITFSWTGPLGYTSSLQNPVVSTPGLYTLTTRNPVNGCTATAAVTVTSNTTPPGVTATGGLKTCLNPGVTLTASSSTFGLVYKWAGPSNYMSNLQNPTVLLAGTYTVTATNPTNGCNSTATAVVTQNTTVPNLTASGTTVSCYVPDPHIVASSTTPGVTFFWEGPAGFTSNIASPTVSVGGAYTVTATNPVNGCTNARTVAVNENLATPVVYAGDDRTLNCNFSTILTNPVGTSTGSNITYLWTTFDGNIVSGATTLYARLDEIGTYTLTVKNTTSGCMVMDSMIVEQASDLTVAAEVLANVSCNGESNGSAKANVTGGASPFTYIWSNGAQTATINNLSIGAYTVTVSDSQGCLATSSATITQPAVLVASVSSTNQTQVGVNNGSASVSPSGGVGPYAVLWSNGGTFLTIMNLAPGAYTVTVTDSKGCTASNTVNVNPVNCTITGNITTVNLNCASIHNGSATANITGAPGPFTYVWSNGAQTRVANDLDAGNYTVTATSTNGCTLVLTTQITSPQALSLSVVSNMGVSCSGQTNGAATMSASGGVSPYTYSWSNNTTGANLANVAIGTYTCTVSDANGCSSTQTTTITSPQPVALAMASKTDVPCIDSQTGSITLAASGGTSPYNYLWSNSAIGATANGLGLGTYTCTVTDSHGCSKTQSAQIVSTDNVPPQLILKNISLALNASGSASVTAAMFDNGSFDQSCSIVNWTVSPTSFNCSNLGTNTITLTATDKNGNTATGTAVLTIVDDLPPTLTCPVNQTAMACASIVNFPAPQFQDNCSGGSGLTQTNGLPSGASFPVGVTLQKFSYTDAGGNTATCEFTVTVTGGLTAQMHTTPASCVDNCDATALLSILGGGTASSVIWSNGQTGLNAVGLCPGTYFATVTDANGCTQNFSAEISHLDLQPPSIFCPNDVVVGFCNATVNYNAPQVLDNCVIDLQNLQMTSGLPSGIVFPFGSTVQVFKYTDGSGNTAECSFTVTVHLAASINSSATQVSCSYDCNGSATVDVSGGNGPFGILWSNGTAGAVAANLCPGSYDFTVTDGDGCQQNQSVTLFQPTAISLVAANVFNDHNNAGTGSIFIVASGGTFPYQYAWTRDGVPFASTQHVFDLFAGEYSLTITDANGCIFVSPLFVVTSTVPTQEAANDLNWEIYPNPVQSELYIKMQPIDARISVFDVSGRLILEQDLNDASADGYKLDLSTAPEGMLMVRLSTKQGLYTKMVMKVDSVH
jgi:hypothetical protein